MDGAVGVVDVAGEGLLGPSGHPGCSTLWGRGLSLRDGGLVTIKRGVGSGRRSWGSLWSRSHPLAQGPAFAPYLEKGCRGLWDCISLGLGGAPALGARPPTVGSACSRWMGSHAERKDSGNVL